MHEFLIPIPDSRFTLHGSRIPNPDFYFTSTIFLIWTKLRVSRRIK
jgi:hypothetical protein